MFESLSVVPMLGGLVVLTVVAIVVIIKRRNRIESDYAVDTTLDETPIPRSADAAAPADADPDVLQLLESAAVAPVVGGASDLAADPWD